MRLIIVLLILFTPSSFALGKLGHKLICDQAFELLTSDQRSKVSNLLAAIPKTHRHLINQYNRDGKNEPITLGKACTWPDAIKKLDEYDSFKSWHYVNLDRDIKAVPEKLCENDCITQAIPYHLEQYQSVNNEWEKAQALMFLGHWLGDIHQPMHVSFKSDLGGNRTKISGKGKCKSLHWYWDECILTNESKHYADHKKAIVKALINIQIATNETAQVWANETYQLAIKDSTLYCQWKSGTCEPYVGTIKLSSQYQTTHYLLIIEQMAKASLRLSKLM